MNTLIEVALCRLKQKDGSDNIIRSCILLIAQKKGQACAAASGPHEKGVQCNNLGSRAQGGTLLLIDGYGRQLSYRNAPGQVGH